jgi:tetratricopeptide (TPR) repeat protein
MVFVADDFAAWLIGLIADAGRKRLTLLALGSDQERALREAARVAVEQAAEDLASGDQERAALALVISEVFGEPLRRPFLAGELTLLEEVQARISAQMEPLDDSSLTDTGQSAAQVLGVPAAALAERVTSRLLGEIMTRGAAGGPLEPLASQLNHDVTHLQGARIEDMTARVLAVVTAHGGQVSRFSAAEISRGLPADTEWFTGRESEMSRLISLAGSHGGVIEIDGMAGVGKTAFAVHAAHRLAPGFPDGQLFVRLHAHRLGQVPATPEEVLGGLLLATGLAAEQIPPGIQAREDLWRERMTGRKALLVLDDAAGSGQVRPLLPDPGDTLALVTSRRRLAGLPEAVPLTLEVLSPGDAVRLLARIADRPGLRLDAGAAAAAARLCGYLPLAVAVAASQLKHHPAWTGADLAARLAAESDQAVTLQAEDVSVAVALSLSYRDLAPRHQQLFRRLGLHPGAGIDAHAAAALDGTQPGMARSGLEELYSHHLIDEPASGRYHFHDLIRQHARSLAIADEADAQEAMARLVDYYQHAATSASDIYGGQEPARASHAGQPDLRSREEAAAWLDAERLNLGAVIGYAADHGKPAEALAISAGLAGFLLVAGYWDQALAIHASCLATARDGDDRPGEAATLARLGAIHQAAGSYEEALASQRRALDICRDLADHDGQAGALTGIGIVQYLTGDYPAAADSLAQAMEIYRALGNRPGEAYALNCIGIVRYLADDYPAAVASLTQALGLFRAAGDRRRHAHALKDLGIVQRLTGDYPAATASLTQALDTCAQFGDRLGEAFASNYIGTVQRLTGDYPAATASLTHALHLYRLVGSRLGEAHALNDIGILGYLAGDYPAAADSLAKALEIYRHVGSSLGQAHALHDTGILQRLTGDYPAADSSHHQALELFRSISDKLGQAHALDGVGNLHRLSGDYPAATTALTQALDICLALGNPDGQAAILNDIGDLSRAQSDFGHAHDCYDRALTIARATNIPREQARALEGKGLCHRDNSQPTQARYCTTVPISQGAIT